MQHARECYTRIYYFTVEKCLQTRVPQSVVTGSERNCGIIKILKYSEKFQVYLEISRVFLSGSWQYWSNGRGLPTVNLCCLACKRVHMWGFIWI